MSIIEIPRLLPLEGGLNLRDMGGYEAADGRTVKYRTLYRSGLMAMLTEADEAHLAGLGIATVCDLRTIGERRRDPTRWCEPAGVHLWARDHEHNSGVVGRLLRPGTTPAMAREAMIDLYRDLPVEHAPSYAYMFERLKAGHVPLLFNCSAGKDRTGVAAALILAALGVSREQILEDYLLTNQHIDSSRLIERVAESARLRQAGEGVIAPLMAADADYLAMLYQTLDQDHGGIDAYLERLGVDAAAKERLRELLLD